MAEALRTDHGAIVADLNLGGSSTNPNVTNSAYAVYNQGNKTVSRLIIFNYANSSQDFALPGSVFSSSGTATVKFLAAATPEEETNISWGTIIQLVHSSPINSKPRRRDLGTWSGRRQEHCQTELGYAQCESDWLFEQRLYFHCTWP